jgi:hypothetical protein
VTGGRTTVELLSLEATLVWGCPHGNGLGTREANGGAVVVVEVRASALSECLGDGHQTGQGCPIARNTCQPGGGIGCTADARSPR